MPKIIEMVGRRYGKLVVLSRDTTTSDVKHPKWNCVCDCGNFTSVYGNSLQRNSTKSCGCMSSRYVNNLKDINTKHGMSRTKIYHVYHALLSRCRNPKDKAYKHYGARGIDVCNEWIESFDAFHGWTLTSGYVEGLTLERIDVNLGYCPSNCTWIPQSEQPKNRRGALDATIQGETKTLKEWSEISGIDYNTLRCRKVRYKWNDEDLLSKPTPFHRY